MFVMAQDQKEARKYLARQLELQAVIKGIPAKHLEMSVILENREQCEYNLSEQPTSVTVEHLCGTIGCIAGWAHVYPKFVRQGIRSNHWSEMTSAERFFDMPSFVFREVSEGSYEARAAGPVGKFGRRGRQHKKIALARIAEAIANYKRRWNL